MNKQQKQPNNFLAEKPKNEDFGNDIFKDLSAFNLKTLNMLSQVNTNDFFNSYKLYSPDMGNKDCYSSELFKIANSLNLNEEFLDLGKNYFNFNNNNNTNNNGNNKNGGMNNSSTFLKRAPTNNSFKAPETSTNKLNNSKDLTQFPFVIKNNLLENKNLSILENYDECEYENDLQDYYAEDMNLLENEWSKIDDSKLYALVNKYGDKNWDFIAQFFDNTKSAVKCFKRWNVLVKPKIVKGPWNIEEDKKLIDWIKNNGPNNWTGCADLIPGRTGKQCRERWANALNPLLKKGLWEQEEDYIIFKLFKMIGSKWSAISNYLNGRTENSTKNRFYSTLRRYAGELKPNKVKTKMNFEHLMNYFQIAYEDKTRDIDELIEKSCISENETLNIQTLKKLTREFGHLKKIVKDNKNNVSALNIDDELKLALNLNNNDNKDECNEALKSLFLKTKRNGNIENNTEFQYFGITEVDKIEALKKNLKPKNIKNNLVTLTSISNNLANNDPALITEQNNLGKFTYINNAIKSNKNNTKYESIEDLTKKIESFCDMSAKLSKSKGANGKLTKQDEDEKTKSEELNYIGNRIAKDFEEVKQNEPIDAFNIVSANNNNTGQISNSESSLSDEQSTNSKENYNENKMNILITQLNDLEKLLKQTKSEIRKIHN